MPRRPAFIRRRTARRPKLLIMALRAGTYRMGPDSGRLLVSTSRTGLGARAGHDLTLEAAGWRCSVNVGANGLADSSVMVEVDADSLDVREGRGGVVPLSEADKTEIKRIIRDKILHPPLHPTITFRSARITGSPQSFTADGDLTVMNLARPLTVRGTIGNDGRVRARALVLQTQWGIKPYATFFGALRLANEVAIEVDALLTPS